MTTLATGKCDAPRRGISPDVEATAEVLRDLYLPGECRHLVALLQEDAAAAEPAAGRPAAEATESDAAFLHTVHALLAAGPSPLAPARAASALRDTLQIRVRFLDALQDELWRARAAGLPPRLPQPAELAELLAEERARYGVEEEPARPLAFRPQLRAA